MNCYGDHCAGFGRMQPGRGHVQPPGYTVQHALQPRNEDESSCATDAAAAAAAGKLGRSAAVVSY